MRGWGQCSAGPSSGRGDGWGPRDRLLQKVSLGNFRANTSRILDVEETSKVLRGRKKVFQIKLPSGMRTGLIGMRTGLILGVLADSLGHSGCIDMGITSGTTMVEVIHRDQRRRRHIVSLLIESLIEKKQRLKKGSR